MTSAFKIFCEYIPYEAVYAYIEAKYNLTSDTIGKAIEQCGNVKKLSRDKLELSETDFGKFKGLQIGVPLGWPELRNPIYTVIISRDTDLDVQRLLNYIACDANYSPDLIISRNNIVCLPTISDSFKSPFVIPSQTTNLNVIEKETSIGIGIFVLLSALNYIKLKPINYKELMAFEINK